MDDEKKDFEFKFTMAWHNDRLNDEYKEQDRSNKKNIRNSDSEKMKGEELIKWILDHEISISNSFEGENYEIVPIEIEKGDLIVEIYDSEKSGLVRIPIKEFSSSSSVVDVMDKIWELFKRGMTN